MSLLPGLNGIRKASTALETLQGASTGVLGTTWTRNNRANLKDLNLYGRREVERYAARRTTALM